MIKTVIVLPDGREITSGASTVNSIKSSKITMAVNDAQDLSLGSACSNMAEIQFISTDGSFTMNAGTEFSVYEETNGARKKVGLFTAEKPSKVGTYTFKLTAYDRISKMDKDMTSWLSGLKGWPYTLLEFAGMVCRACGLELKNRTIPNENFRVQTVAAGGVTGRQLIKWCGEIAGRFIRADADGKIEFAWYNTVQDKITPRQQKSGSLKFEDYACAKINKVIIRDNDNDEGAGYPESGDNAYIISGNLLMNGSTEDAKKQIAQALYNQLKNFSYTPASWKAWRNEANYRAGDAVTIVSAGGAEINVCIFKSIHTGQRVEIASTGSSSRGSSTAVNKQKQEGMYGMAFGAANAAREAKETAVKTLAGLEQITQYDPETGYAIAEAALYATILDSSMSPPQIKSSRISTAVIRASDGSMKSMAEILADVINLNGRVNLTGSLSIRDGNLYCANDVAYFSTINAKYPDFSDAGSMRLSNRSFVPRSVTLADGSTITVLAEGSAPSALSEEGE